VSFGGLPDSVYPPETLVSSGMADVPEDAPVTCPACGAYDSVSVHADPVMVNLLDNDRYRRVCVDPGVKDGEGRLYFYHHTHEQA
jgi:hypothetical protein